MKIVVSGKKSKQVRAKESKNLHIETSEEVSIEDPDKKAIAKILKENTLTEGDIQDDGKDAKTQQEEKD